MIATDKPARRVRRAPNTNGSEPPKAWRERIQDVRTAYGNIPGAFKLVWGADKRSTIVMATLTLVSAFLPLSQAWAGGLILNSVTHSFQLKITPQAGLQVALPYLALEFGLLLLSAIITQLRRLAEHVLNARLGHHINSAVIRKRIVLPR